MSKGFKRQHSSSVHEQISWTSFQNLASHLLPNRQLQNDESSKTGANSQAVASPNLKGSIQESSQPEDDEEEVKT